MIQKTLVEAEGLINGTMIDDRKLEEMIMIKQDQLRKMAEVEIESLKKMTDVTIKTIERVASMESENLKRIASVESENLKRIASVESENLKEAERTISDNLREITKTRSQNLIEYAKKISENLKKTASIESEKMLEHARTVSENLKRIASVGSEKTMEYARTHSSSTIKNTHDWNEQIRKIKHIKNLRLQNKRQLALIVAVGVIAIGTSALYVNNQSNQQQNSQPFTTNYLIQNLRGDKVDTWVSWKKPDDAMFHIHIQGSKFVTKERTDAIFDVIMSQQTVEVDDSVLHKGPMGTSSVYYTGWLGALNSITDKTKLNIPKNLHFHVDDEIATGDIEIELTDLANPDGYSAYTKSIVDEENHQILKSTITVYEIDKINIEGLKTLTRHELGHGFGLAHSTAPEDLMAPIITTNYPYISECDLDALRHLYDGGESSAVICVK